MEYGKFRHAIIKANSLVFTIGGLESIRNEHEPLTVIEAYNDIIW